MFARKLMKNLQKVTNERLFTSFWLGCNITKVGDHTNQSQTRSNRVDNIHWSYDNKRSCLPWQTW